MGKVNAEERVQTAWVGEHASLGALVKFVVRALHFTALALHFTALGVVAELAAGRPCLGSAATGCCTC